MEARAADSFVFAERFQILQSLSAANEYELHVCVAAQFQQDCLQRPGIVCESEIARRDDSQPGGAIGPRRRPRQLMGPVLHGANTLRPNSMRQHFFAHTFAQYDNDVGAMPYSVEQSSERSGENALGSHYTE